MKDTFPTWDEVKDDYAASGLPYEKYLECYNLHLRCKLDQARTAAKITQPEFYSKIVEAARIVGYAIAVHGSRARDVDLIAIPWTEEAVDHQTLLEVVKTACEGHLKPPWTEKPHGRMSHFILVLGGVIDFCVMPRRVG